MELFGRKNHFVYLFKTSDSPKSSWIKLQRGALKIKKSQYQKSKLYDFAFFSQFLKRIIFNDPEKLRFENQKVTISKKQAL